MRYGTTIQHIRLYYSGHRHDMKQKAQEILVNLAVLAAWPGYVRPDALESSPTLRWPYYAPGRGLFQTYQWKGLALHLQTLHMARRLTGMRVDGLWKDSYLPC